MSPTTQMFVLLVCGFLLGLLSPWRLSVNLRLNLRHTVSKKKYAVVEIENGHDGVSTEFQTRCARVLGCLGYEVFFKKDEIPESARYLLFWGQAKRSGVNTVCDFFLASAKSSGHPGIIATKHFVINYAKQGLEVDFPKEVKELLEEYENRMES